MLLSPSVGPTQPTLQPSNEAVAVMISCAVPVSQISIDASFYAGCQTLESVTISSTVTYIGN